MNNQDFEQIFFIIKQDKNDESIRLKITNFIKISEFFRTIYNSPLCKKDENENILLELKEISKPCLRWLRLKYEDEFDIDVDFKHIEDFCKMADFLQMNELKDL